jgi:hypothetical protein
VGLTADGFEGGWCLPDLHQRAGAFLISVVFLCGMEFSGALLQRDLCIRIMNSLEREISCAFFLTCSIVLFVSVLLMVVGSAVADGSSVDLVDKFQVYLNL